MVPKTERFEMRLDEDILTRVDNWRASQEGLPSRSEAMRRLVEFGLTHSIGSKKVNFSDGEKMLMMMIRDLYKHLDIKDGEIDPDFVGEVISGGHTWAPKWELQGLYHDHEDNPKDVSLVIDILDMWSFIESGYSKLSKSEKEYVEKEISLKHVKFPGFDGNNESELMHIAQFLIEEMGRFESFKGRSLNSHHPTIGGYNRMLGEFGYMRATLAGTELSKNQLIKILNARQSNSL